MNGSFVDQNLFPLIAELVPVSRDHDGLLDNLEILRKELVFHMSVFAFESFTGRLLPIAIPSHIRTGKTFSEGTFAKKDLAVNIDIVRGEISCGMHLRHREGCIGL